MKLNNEEKDGLLITVAVIAIVIISIGIVEKFPDNFGKYDGGQNTLVSTMIVFYVLLACLFIALFVINWLNEKVTKNLIAKKTY